jgi:hypothetical protein
VLHGEVLNLTDHNNPRYFYTSANQNGTFNVVTGQGLPITPTAGSGVCILNVAAEPYFADTPTQPHPFPCGLFPDSASFSRGSHLDSRPFF